MVEPLTFTANATLNGIATDCTDSYRVDPHYPTLSLMTVSVNISLAAVPVGTVLLVNVNGTGATLCPFTSNQILGTAQSRTCSYSERLTPGHDDPKRRHHQHHWESPCRGQLIKTNPCVE